MAGKNVTISVFLDVNANTKKAKKAMSQFDKSMQGLSKGLVIMFAGQAIQRSIQGITDNVRQLVGIEEIRNAMYTDLLIPSVLKEMDAKLELFDLTSQLSDQEKETVGDILLGTEKLAGIVASAGQAIAAANALGKGAGAAFAAGLTIIENIDAVETAIGGLLLQTDAEEESLAAGDDVGIALAKGITAGAESLAKDGAQSIVDKFKENLDSSLAVAAIDNAITYYNALKQKLDELFPGLGGVMPGANAPNITTTTQTYGGTTIYNINDGGGGRDFLDPLDLARSVWQHMKNLGSRAVSNRGRVGA